MSPGSHMKSEVKTQSIGATKEVVFDNTGRPLVDINCGCHDAPVFLSGLLRAGYRIRMTVRVFLIPVTHTSVALDTEARASW